MMENVRVLSNELIASVFSDAVKKASVSCTDCNADMPSGFYRCYSPLNAPVKPFYGILVEFWLASNIRAQLMLSGGYGCYCRVNWDGWGGWNQIVTQGV